MAKLELATYKKFVSQQLNQLTPYLQNYALGDFSQNIPVSEQENEFTELLVGLNLMVDDFREMLREKEETISQLKQVEEQRNLNAQILTILNRTDDWKNLIKDLLLEIKAFTNFDAVGIRLKEGEDFPYYVTQGFPVEFVEQERYLCARDQQGELLRDTNGKPYLECMCGVVICGRTNPSKACFTEAGSFWTNNTTKLLAETTEEDRQSLLRNRCNRQGYESMALIPLTVDKQIIGLLQLNDKRTNQLTLEKIEFFEAMGNSIGIAMQRMEKELALRANETLLREIAANYPNSYLSIIEPDLKIGFTSGQEFKKQGLDPNSFVGLTLEQVFGNFAAQVRENYLKAFAGEETEFELFINNQHQLYRALPLTDDSGVVKRILAVVENITERKQIEQALAQERVLLRTVIDNLPDTIYVKDQAGRKILANAADLEIIGKPEDQVLGKTDLELYPAEIADSFYADDLLVLQNGHAVINREELSVSNSGKKRWMLTSKLPLRDSQGHITGLVGIGHDITESKQAEEALRESETKYRSLIENSNDAIYLLYDNKFEIVNKKFEQTIGYNAEEMNRADFNFIRLVSPKSRPLIEDRLKRIAKGEKLAPRYEFTALTKNGTEIEVEASVAYLNCKDGIAVQGILRDITERKKAEAQMQNDLKEKTILLSEIHHRVKNSLQVVSSLLHLQSNKITNKHIRNLFLESRQRIIMMAAVYEKLYLSKNFASIDFKEYLTDILKPMYHVSELYKRVELKIDVQNVVLGLDDAVPVALIVNELFTNTVRHAFPGNRKGNIEISFTLLDDNTYQLIYRDNGVGLPANINFDSAETLGLHLIKNLAKQIEGKASWEQNEWTTFKIVFNGYESGKKKYANARENS